MAGKALITVLAICAVGDASRRFGRRTPLPDQVGERQSSTCLGPYSAQFTAVGCYTDNPARTLTVSATGGDGNSAEACANSCGLAGYKFAGSENGNECWCANSIASTGVPDAGQCTTPCTGNAQETCGGVWHINIYQIANPNPSPPMIGRPDCARTPLCGNPVCDTSLPVQQRAAGLVAALTLQEKITNLMNTAPGVSRLGVPSYEWWNEALHGVGGSPGVRWGNAGEDFFYATSFPAPILTAAAFDDALVTNVAATIGREVRAFSNANRAGLDVWTPNVNPFRDPRWGRGQEVAGEDVLHVQRYAYHFVSGIQNTTSTDPGKRLVTATCKHLLAYDQEQNRHSVNLNPSAQDMTEYYAAPFRTCARQAQVGAMMCSYNAVQGVPACANEYTMQNLVREQWGWDGPGNWITSDCGAVQDIDAAHQYVNSDAAAAAVALNAGTDLACESTIYGSLVQAVASNFTTEAIIDKSLTRLYSMLVQQGWFASTSAFDKLSWTDVATPDAQKLALQAAAEGLTLLKNNGALPLASGKKVALIGPWANATGALQGSYQGNAEFLISVLAAFQGSSFFSSVTYQQGADINSGSTSGFSAAIAAAQAADIVVYAGGIDTTVEAEEMDRQTITWPTSQQSLITQLSQVGKPLIVVQFGGGQLDDSALLSSSGVGAILWAGYPGQSGGTAVLNALTGAYPPAGRLTISQYPASYVNQVRQEDPGLRPNAATGNPGRTYAWYPNAVLEFGYGLHYTTFGASWATGPAATYSIASVVGSATGTTIESSTFTTLSVNIHNTGTVASDYVALVFINTTNAGPAPYPRKKLAGYTRVFGVAGGATTQAQITIPIGAIARADLGGNLTVFPGTYTVAVDHDAKITAQFTLTGSPAVIEAVPVLPTNPQVIKATHLGCFADSTSDRILKGASVDLGTVNSVDTCVYACQQAGFLFAAVEDATQCFCATTAPTGSPVSASSCSTKCPGASSETCGAGGFADVYSLIVSPTGTPSITPPGNHPTGSWFPTGCYTDSGDARTLTGASTSGSSNTIESCQAFCAASGFSLAGVEFSDECYCGSAIENGAVTRPQDNCNMACSGNAGELCGGGNSIEVYTFQTSSYVPHTVALEYIGCWTDDPANRVLSGPSATFTGINAPQLCADWCGFQGYGLAAVEFAYQCFCGNSILAGTKVVESDCSTPCPGNSFEICGNGNRMSLYNISLPVSPQGPAFTS